ncbi:S-adenosyl-L-methionine-dependent methyltransferase [Ascodesmis nigricans]|uniref:S-adenosyl-L-methionine-dependent methyltransferase n=1 Tax=Ascodesmis nigricans TaxID=341454 RepID=A0A4S2N621_9PEZI|nr:S-adenosyl-L-methionine-dependent methyltransferase [Ascodesmis nigricans]
MLGTRLLLQRSLLRRIPLARSLLLARSFSAPLYNSRTPDAVQMASVQTAAKPEQLALNKRSNTHNKRKQRKPKPVAEDSPEQVVLQDVQRLLATKPPPSDLTPPVPLTEPFTLVELAIEDLSCAGEGLAVVGQRVYVVPFSIPGDVVEAKVVRHSPNGPYTECDFVRVINPSPDRDDSLVKCQYFAKCAGCHYQMMPYERQLKQKREVIVRAFAHYFPNDSTDHLIPEVGDTIGSPLQYGYRTKLTPHFDKRKNSTEPPEIGFTTKGRRHVIDIEDCPIGTEAVRAGLKERREYVRNNWDQYKRGATVLLRESTTREPKTDTDTTTAPESNTEDELVKYIERKFCISDNKGQTTEYIGDYKFTNSANGFFQNNNSILPGFVSYIRDNLSLPAPASSTTPPPEGETPEPAPPIPPKYLVDAYCGSGLFTVTCGSAVQQSIGIDISAESIAYASQNASQNSISNASFQTGTASEIFKNINFPGSETSIIIDPSRKGCDHDFLNQLLQFRPKRIVYVSCNVHTQARDVAYVLGDERGVQYKIDSVRGFDFFPQTHHVESVVIMTRDEEPKKPRRYSPSDKRARKENARARSWSKDRARYAREAEAKEAKLKEKLEAEGEGNPDAESVDTPMDMGDEEPRGRKRDAGEMEPEEDGVRPAEAEQRPPRKFEIL